MAKRRIAKTGRVGKPTLIYGLIDPRTNQLRYVGKTVKSEAQRLSTHVWHARFFKRRRYVLAWIKGVLDDGYQPEIFTIETVPVGGDWIEAEKFWIVYFRSIGADLCNLTDGGEGALGAKASEARKQQLRDQWAGDAHPTRGKPMPAHVREAIGKANAKYRADPRWREWAAERIRAGITAETHVNSIAALRAIEADPVLRARRDAARREAIQAPEFKAAIGDWSRKNWQVNRDKIIAAQNEGKGEEFIRKQSEAKKLLWSDPEWRARQTRTKKITDAQVQEIRRRLANGEGPASLASEYGVDQSLISRIKTGGRRSKPRS